MESCRCFRCGECCKDATMTLTPQELDLIEQKTGVKPSVIKKGNYYELKGACPFFANNSCSIYEIRPCQCRLYHCGRLKPDDPVLEWLGQIRHLMDINPCYEKYKTEMDEEAIKWGNAHGWNWRKMGNEMNAH